jgi:photosystem II stability/assembly factor-like uncharacterized protein
MGYPLRRRCFVAAAGLSGLLGTRAGWAAFQHPIDEPALASALAPRSPMLAIALAGSRLVAVGARGHIVLSDDDGASWRQAAVPVSIDLMGVSFPSSQRGWAVGQGGVVLKTEDGGVTWIRVLAGHQASRIAVEYYKARAAAEPDAAPALKEASAVLEMAFQPFLDVHFENDMRGFIVGTFNRIFATTDGGQTWVPWSHAVPNPGGLNFYGVRGHGGRVFLVGEQGQAWRRRGDESRFSAVPTPYKGTLFGLVAGPGTTVFAFGMRGAMYRSQDDGSSWSRVDLHTVAGITGGTMLNDGRIVVVDQAGTLHIGDDKGSSFAPKRLSRPMPYSAVATGRGHAIVLAGASGVQATALS